MRANFYVDGYNLYRGMCDAGLHGHIWLDLQGLCNNLKKRTETLGRIRYFTSLPDFAPAKARRHQTYLDSLEAACPRVEVEFGTFSDKDARVYCDICKIEIRVECAACGWKMNTKKHEEKQTDVNLAVHLLNDAYTPNEFDVAYIISGDSDLLPAVRMVKSIFPEKKVGMYFPPSRYLGVFTGVADCAVGIHANEIKRFPLPDRVGGATGPIAKPPSWNS